MLISSRNLVSRTDGSFAIILMEAINLSMEITISVTSHKGIRQSLSNNSTNTVSIGVGYSVGVGKLMAVSSRQFLSSISTNNVSIIGMILIRQFKEWDLDPLTFFLAPNPRVAPERSGRVETMQAFFGEGGSFALLGAFLGFAF